MSKYYKLLNTRVRSPSKINEIENVQYLRNSLKIASNKKYQEDNNKQTINILEGRQNSMPSILKPITNSFMIPERIKIGEQVQREDTNTDLKVMMHYVKTQRRTFQELGQTNTILKK